MNDSEKIKPRSPTEINKNMSALSSAFPWKIWMKIDDNTDGINQSIAIPFNELDTIDDLKTKLLERLNPYRWAHFLDNTSIAIGFHGISVDHEDVLSATSPVESVPFLSRSKSFLTANLSASPPFNIDRSSNPKVGTGANNITSPQRSRSNSSGITSVIPRSPIVRYPSISPYSNLHSYQQLRREFSPAPLSVATSFGTTRARYIGTYKKSFRMVTDNDSPCSSQELREIIFEADELVVSIYTDLFGHLGSQRASEALSVITSRAESSFITPNDLENLNATKFLPTNEEIARQILENTEETGENDNFAIHTPPPPDLNINETTGAPELLENPSEQGEGEREFKFIADEEQLLKESQCLNDTERNSDHPKPAILLLPKGYTGDVDFSESTSRETSDVSSQSQASTPKTNPKPNLTLKIPSYTPLDENEVGLIHPLLESERHKTESPVVLMRSDRHIQNASEPIPQSEQPNENTNSSTSKKVFPNITVLIVEDNVINRTILCSFLKKHKISYKVAKNGQEAVDKWKEGGIDLIFMDLQLPVLSGTEAAKQIRDAEKNRAATKNDKDKITKKAPVIIVAFTASDSQTVKTNALVSGCNDYLTKPVNLHWLSKKINEWGCMQALIDFDGWKEGQSRMTERLMMKASPKIPIKPELKPMSSSHRIRSSSNSSSHSRLSENKSNQRHHSRKSTGNGVVVEMTSTTK